MEKEILEILKSMQGDMKSMQGELKQVNQRLDKVDQRLDKLENKTDLIDVQIKENTQILKALQHSSEVQKAEIDKLNIAISKEIGDIKGDINILDKKIDSLEGTNKSLLEMYGEHEAEIRTIKRRYV